MKLLIGWQQQKKDKLLHQLNLCVEAKDRERNKKHEVWENSFDWKECRTNKFMNQKLDYMHDNPCRRQMESGNRCYQICT